MDDAVADRSTVGSRTPLERPRDAHELALHRVAAESNDGVAVAAHVEKREVRCETTQRRRETRGGSACVRIESQPCPQPATAALIRSTDRSASAAMVSVGFEAADVGNTPLPSRNRFG